VPAWTFTSMIGIAFTMSFVLSSANLANPALDQLNTVGTYEHALSSLVLCREPYVLTAEATREPGMSRVLPAPRTGGATRILSCLLLQM
jgi:hypothetical protein